MFNNEMILELLKTSDAETIANAFADALNQAIETSKVDEKKEDTQVLMNHIDEYLAKYYPDIPSGTVEAELFIELMDNLVSELAPLLKVLDGVKNKTGKEDPLLTFFKANGI